MHVKLNKAQFTYRELAGTREKQTNMELKVIAKLASCI